jgi:hypothetical protein
LYENIWKCTAPSLYLLCFTPVHTKQRWSGANQPWEANFFVSLLFFGAKLKKKEIVNVFRE